MRAFSYRDLRLDRRMRIVVGEGKPIYKRPFGVARVESRDSVYSVKQLVNDTIISNTNTIGVVGTRQLLRSMRQWLVNELRDSDEDARDIVARNAS